MVWGHYQFMIMGFHMSSVNWLVVWSHVMSRSMSNMLSDMWCYKCSSVYIMMDYRVSIMVDVMVHNWMNIVVYIMDNFFMMNWLMNCPVDCVLNFWMVNESWVIMSRVSSNYMLMAHVMWVYLMMRRICDMFMLNDWVNCVNWSSMDSLEWSFNLNISNLWLNIDDMTRWINSNNVLCLVLDWHFNYLPMGFSIDLSAVVRIFNHVGLLNCIVSLFMVQACFSMLWNLNYTSMWGSLNFYISWMCVFFNWHSDIPSMGIAMMGIKLAVVRGRNSINFMMSWLRMALVAIISHRVRNIWICVDWALGIDICIFI